MTGRQRIWTVLRWAFFAASAAYLVNFARTTLASGHDAAWPGTSVFVPAVAGYAATAAFAVLGWHALLSRIVSGVGLTIVAQILCTTQIAKYLPGNIGHHLGRIAMARSAFAAPAATVAASIAQEGAVACLASLGLGAACYAAGAALPVHVAGFDVRWALAAALTAGLAALALVNAGRHRLMASPPATALVARLAPAWPAVAAALPWYLAISLLNGLAIGCIANAFVPVHWDVLLLLTGAYALAWAIGFLLPGAPGGLGVREAALVSLLGQALPASAILEITLWSRIATVVADLLIFGAGLMLVHGRGRHGASD